MWKNWYEFINGDLNDEDGVIIHFFGQFTEKIFMILMMTGVPFLIYLFIQFLLIS